MKKAIRLIIALTIALALVVSCSAEPEAASGTLKVDVSSSITKGINPQIDLEAANYRLVVTDSSENVKSFDIGTMTSAEQSFPAGSYSLRAYAENKDGIEIGESEEKSFTIYPNRTTSVSLDIHEKAGNGSITITFSGLDVFEPGTEFSVKFMKGTPAELNLEVAGSFPLYFNEDGTASMTATLQNGFYAIFLESSDDAADLFLDSVRIVSEDEISASYSFEFSGDGNVTITNGIVKTPTISVEKSGDELPITLTATIENLDGNASYAWYMDGVALSGANEKVLTITAESDIEAGEHKFVLLVISNTGIVWSSAPIAVAVPSAMRSYDLSKMDLDSGFEIEVGADEDIMLTNVNIADGVVAEITELGASKGAGNNGNGNNGFFTQTGDFMFSPDKNMNAYFNGSNNGKNNNLRLKIKKFKNIDSDFSMTKEEYPTVNGLLEEFYYVDFNSEAFKHLNPEEIVFIEMGKCAKGFMLVPSVEFELGSKNNLFDLSDYSQSGFGVYSHVSSSFMNPENEYHLYIVSPEHLTLYRSITLDRNVGALKVTDTGNFKLTYTFENIENSDLENAAKENPCLRYTDGTYSDYVMVPEIDFENKKLSFYLKDINEPMLFNYIFNCIEYSQVTVKIERVSEEEIPIFLNFSSLTESGIPILAPSSEGLLIIPYINHETMINIETSCQYSSYTYYCGERQQLGSMSDFAASGQNISGVSFFKYSNAVEGDLLLTIKPFIPTSTNPWGEETHIKFDYEINEYTNDDGETMPGVQAFNCRLKSDKALGEYGYIYYGLGGIRTTHYTFNYTTSGNAAGSPETGTLSYNVGTDNDDKAVDVRIIEAWLKDGYPTKLMCRVSLGKGDAIQTVEDIEFNVDESVNHNWQIIDGIAKCSKCEEQRSCSVCYVRADIDSIVDASGIRTQDSFISLIIPEINFSSIMANERQIFPASGVNCYVYVIPPTSDSNVITTSLGDGRYDIKVVYSN